MVAYLLSPTPGSSISLVIETDYLVVGAGAAGMAFTDALIADSDAEVVMIDRRHAPGGHWNDAYPFVRLHQPAAYYGVNSRVLGNDTIDESGEKREITTEQWRKDSRAGDVVDSLLDFAKEHAFGYHQRGLAPRYFLRDYFGSSAHVHEWDLHVEPPISEQGTLAPAPLASNTRNREGQVIDVLLRHAEHALEIGHKKVELAMGVLERQQERADARNEWLADRNDALNSSLDVALDRKLERDIRMANEQLKLRVKSAVAEQAVAALPAFAGLGHRLLNAKMGVREEKPLNAELEDFFINLSKLPADDVHPIIAKVFSRQEDRDQAILDIQRYRARNQVKALDAHAVAAADGVTKAVSFQRLGELAAAKKQADPDAPARPSPFR
jgi:DNA polymerase IIIc chi subunit